MHKTLELVDYRVGSGNLDNNKAYILSSKVSKKI